jgi:hypothetical protein
MTAGLGTSAGRANRSGFADGWRGEGITMTVRMVQWTLDVHDVDVMANFWSRALGYEVRKRSDGACRS